MANEKTYQGFYNSPIGIIRVTADDNNILEVNFVETGLLMAQNNHPLVAKCIVQLTEYFESGRAVFDLPMLIQGTEFQQKVLKEVAKIGFGSKASYLQVAKRIGDTQAVRAVGNTNGRNKLLILIPCHRVVGNHGELTGYAGGIWRKQWLLNHESKQAGVGQMSLFS